MAKTNLPLRTELDGVWHLESHPQVADSSSYQVSMITVRSSPVSISSWLALLLKVTMAEP